MSGSHHVAGHNISHGHAVTGNAGRIAGHGVANTGHNALATHNQLNGARNQFAHNQLSHNQFAHNQFAAQNFHGLNNFNHTGFNRNAFGNHANWNHWGGRFWGAGWNNWGWGWGGWAGPVFWPFLLGDVLSFIFWPYAYYDPFWWYGSPFIFASIFAPGPYFGPDYGYGSDYYGYGYGTGYYGSPVRQTSTTTALAVVTIAPPLAGGTPPGPSKLIARRSPKPIPRRSKVAPA